MEIIKRKSVLYIEDNQHDFKTLKREVEENFSLLDIKVRPDYWQSKGDEFSMSKILKDILAGNANDLLPEIASADIIIIDNCLRDYSDNTGISLINSLHKRAQAHGEELNLVLLTNDDDRNPDLDEVRDKCLVLHKYRSQSTDTLLQFIASRTGKNRKLTHQKSVRSKWDLFWGKRRWQEAFADGLGYLIMALTVFAFLFGTCKTVGYLWGAFQSSSHYEKSAIVVTASKSSPEMKTVTVPPGDSLKINLKGKETLMIQAGGAPEETSKPSDPDYLKLAEHIFLTFLPFFILFSFLGYYNAYLKNLWLGANMSKTDQSHATRTLKFSKALFASSIIATVIIHTIEEITKEQRSVIALSAYGVLLLILIGYYVFLERESEGHGTHGDPPPRDGHQTH